MLDTKSKGKKISLALPVLPGGFFILWLLNSVS